MTTKPAPAGDGASDMRIIHFFLFVTLFAFWGCEQRNAEASSSGPRGCVSGADAEKILGEAARLAESSSEGRDGVERGKCTFTAVGGDSKSDRAGTLYYLFERYRAVKAAQEAYAAIVKSNKSMPGLRKIDGLGDEAFFHSDEANFVMIIFRKGDKMVRLKVNKMTATTSVIELERVSARIASRL